MPICSSTICLQDMKPLLLCKKKKTAAAVWAPDQSRHVLRKPQSGYEAVVVQLRSLTGAGHTGVGGLLFLLGFFKSQVVSSRCF